MGNEKGEEFYSLKQAVSTSIHSRASPAHAFCTNLLSPVLCRTFRSAGLRAGSSTRHSCTGTLKKKELQAKREGMLRGALLCLGGLFCPAWGVVQQPAPHLHERTERELRCDRAQLTFTPKTKASELFLCKSTTDTLSAPFFCTPRRQGIAPGPAGPRCCRTVPDPLSPSPWSLPAPPVLSSPPRLSLPRRPLPPPPREPGGGPRVSGPAPGGGPALTSAQGCPARPRQSQSRSRSEREGRRRRRPGQRQSSGSAFSTTGSSH